MRNGLVQEAYEKARVMNEIRLKVLELQEKGINIPLNAIGKKIGSLVEVKVGDLLKD